MFETHQHKRPEGLAALLNRLREEGREFEVVQIVEHGSMWTAFLDTYEDGGEVPEVMAAMEEEPEATGGEVESGQQQPVGLVPAGKPAAFNLIPPGSNPPPASTPRRGGGNRKAKSA